MATRTGKKTGPKKRTNTTRKNTKNVKNTQIKSDVISEVLFWVSLAFILLLFLCNFRITGADGVKTSIIGSFGNVLRDIMFGIFGVLAYVAPVLIFVAVYFGLSNPENVAAKVKLSAGIMLFLLCDIVASLFSGIDYIGHKISDFYEYSSTYSKGGGVIGGLLSTTLNSVLGKVGTVIIVLILFIIGIIILTEKSVLNGMKKGSRMVYETAKEDADRRRESAVIRREEREIKKEENKLRMEKKISGVALDTQIPKENSEPENIHEIIIKEPEQVTLDSLSHIQITGASDTKGSLNHPIELKQPEEYAKTEDLFKVEEPSKPQIKKAPEKMEHSDFDLSKDIQNAEQVLPVKYMFPPLTLLKKGETSKTGDSSRQLKETALRLQQTLQTFGVKVTITDISQGPAVTRYELQPEVGVKVSKIVNLADDIKLNLAATDIRIEAPIPGKAAVGIEVPNKENSAVAFRDLLESKDFKEFPSNIAFAVGKDIGGQTIVADIAKMPHLLIAGATGSGKSVCINTLIMGLLYKAHPDDVKMIMIDPKVVELSVYNGIPHLMIPVVTDPKKAAAALHWGVAEMTDRYKKFADFNVRDLKGYNKKVEEMQDNNGAPLPEKLPQVIIIVDELADLMMVAPGEVEESICRLAQLARAAGIHLIIATQRPSVDVITGLIKANMPSRIAFSVSSGVDSRTILDMNGAEKLLGKGDMLFYPQGLAKPSRVQGAFVSDKEVSDVVDFLKAQCAGTNNYASDIEEKIATIGSGSSSMGNSSDNSSDRDEYFVEAARFIIEKDKASIGMLQRVFKVGFNRAARIMDQLADAGIVGEEEGTKPRKILMSISEFEQLLEEI